MTEKLKQTLRDSGLMRWIILFMVSGLMFATYWFQDFFSGLKPLMESQLGITSTQFATMISLTTLANLFGMIIIGGIILDKYGIKITTIVFGTVAALGGIITALGANDILSSDPGTRLLIMTIGRIIFGVGLETTCVLITRTIVKWFKGYELALAMAINMGIGRLGSAIGTAISPEIGGGSVPTAVTLAATLICIGFILMIIYLIFDIKIDKQMEGQSKKEDEEPFRFEDLKKLFTNKSFLLIAGLCVAFYSAVFPFMQYAPDLLINEFGFSYKIEKNPDSKIQEKLATLDESSEEAIFLNQVLTKRKEKLVLHEESAKLFTELKNEFYKLDIEDEEKEKLIELNKVELLKKLDDSKLSHLKGVINQIYVNSESYTGIDDELSKLENKLAGNDTARNVMIFLILFLFGLNFPLIPSKIKVMSGKIAALLIMGVLFISFIYFFRDTFALWIKNGPKAAAFLPMGTILFTPIFGRYVDKKGKAASLMLIGASLLIFSHFIFAFVHSLILCYVGLFALGIAFSLVPAAMWPSVAKIVPERRLGTAYAAMFSIQNWGLFIFFGGIGTVLDWVNPKIVNKMQSIRGIMTSLDLPNAQISDNIQHLKSVGTIAPYNYTVPISLFIICGVAAIFLAIALKKSSAKHGHGLELPSSVK